MSNLARTGQIACHKMVLATALDMAQELYELMAKDNDFYARFKHRGAFVKAVLPQLIPQARATLVAMLSTPISDTLKAEIASALILDNSVRPH